MKLSKEKIIKSKSDFNLVCQEGKAYADKYMVMYVFYAASDADKVGFAAGKRLGAAPVRNRIKRICAHNICSRADNRSIIIDNKNLRHCSNSLK